MEGGIVAAEILGTFEREALQARPQLFSALQAWSRAFLPTSLRCPGSMECSFVFQFEVLARIRVLSAAHGICFGAGPIGPTKHHNDKAHNRSSCMAHMVLKAKSSFATCVLRK